MGLTGSTHRNHSGIMCIGCVGSNASFCYPSSGGSVREDVFHSDEAKRERGFSHYEINTPQSILSSLAITSHFPSEGDIPSTQYTNGGSVSPDYMEQPPDHVIDYWFHRLGLSLDTPLAGTPSGLLKPPSSFSVLDNIGLSVSPTLTILYHIHWSSRRARTLRQGS